MPNKFKPEQVPIEAYKAAHDKALEEGAKWSEILAAALSAWPGMELDPAMCERGTDFIILPLATQEKENG